MSTVLLVEDNELNRDMLTRRLTRKGYKVLIAMDGQTGVDMARDSVPEIILMDMSLPVIDGWEAVRQIKADAKTRNIPVIALTAHAMAGDREKALQAGCEDYDTKPVELDRLLGKMTTLLTAAKKPPKPAPAPPTAPASASVSASAVAASARTTAPGPTTPGPNAIPATTSTPMSAPPAKGQLHATPLFGGEWIEP